MKKLFVIKNLISIIIVLVVGVVAYFEEGC